MCSILRYAFCILLPMESQFQCDHLDNLDSRGIIEAEVGQSSLEILGHMQMVCLIECLGGFAFMIHITHS